MNKLPEEIPAPRFRLLLPRMQKEKAKIFHPTTIILPGRPTH
jgi:hypothetical protein